VQECHWCIERTGQIEIALTDYTQVIYIDIRDTGKGIPKSMFRPSLNRLHTKRRAGPWFIARQKNSGRIPRWQDIRHQSELIRIGDPHRAEKWPVSSPSPRKRGYIITSTLTVCSARKFVYPASAEVYYLKPDLQRTMLPRADHHTKRNSTCCWSKPFAQVDREAYAWTDIAYRIRYTAHWICIYRKYSGNSLPWDGKQNIACLDRLVKETGGGGDW